MTLTSSVDGYCQAVTEIGGQDDNFIMGLMSKNVFLSYQVKGCWFGRGVIHHSDASMC